MKCIKQILTLWKNYETTSTMRFQQFPGKDNRVNQTFCICTECIQSGGQHFQHLASFYYTFERLLSQWIFFSLPSPTVIHPKTQHGRNTSTASAGCLSLKKNKKWPHIFQIQLAALYSPLDFMFTDYRLKLTPHTHSDIKFLLNFVRNSCEGLPNKCHTCYWDLYCVSHWFWRIAVSEICKVWLGLRISKCYITG